MNIPIFTKEQILNAFFYAINYDRKCLNEKYMEKFKVKKSNDGGMMEEVKDSGRV